MLPLTKRQREILDYLNEFIQRHGYAPSLEEIGRQFSLSSLATVHKHLTNLQEKGFIRRAWNRSRSVELVRRAVVRPRHRAADAEFVGRRRADRGGARQRDDCRPRVDGGQARQLRAARRGDSMIDEQIRDGDVHRRGPEVGRQRRDGHRARRRPGRHAQEFYRDNGKIRLQPANPANAADAVRPRQRAGAGRGHRRDAAVLGAAGHNRGL